MANKCRVLSVREVDERLSVDKLSKKGGIFTARQGFFYTSGRTEEDLAKEIKKEYPDAEILDLGKKWTSFRGGAPIERQSHWWVKFKLPCVED